MHRPIAALTLAVVAILGLTACTASADPAPSDSRTETTDAPGDDGQSTEDACALIGATIEGATEAFESTDEATPESVVAAMRSATETLSLVADEITNDEVAALLPDLVDMFAQTADVMEAIVTGDTAALGELGELGEEFTDTTARFQELCLS